MKYCPGFLPAHHSDMELELAFLHTSYNYYVGMSPSSEPRL
jgi:hypothetical protein